MGIMLWNWRSGSKTPPPLLLFGGLMLLVGSLFLLLMGNYAYKEHRLSSEGMLTDGIVVKKALNQASDNGTSKTTYEVDYTFIAADGRKIAGHDTVDPDVWDQIREGGPVQIDYAARKPQLNQIGPARGNSWAEFLVLGLASVIWLLGAILAVKGLRARPPAQSGIASRTVSDEAEVQADVPPFLKNLGPWTVFGGILLFIGAIFLLVGVFNLQQERAFRAEGRTAAGIVLTKSSHVEYDHQNNTQHTHYDIGYRFPTEDGNSVKGSAEVNWRTWTSIHERDPLQITYLAAHPWKNRLAAERPGFLLWLITVLGGLLTAGGVTLISYGVLCRAGHTPQL